MPVSPFAEEPQLGATLPAAPQPPRPRYNPARDPGRRGVLTEQQLAALNAEPGPYRFRYNTPNPNASAPVARVGIAPDPNAPAPSGAVDLMLPPPAAPTPARSGPSPLSTERTSPNTQGLPATRPPNVLGAAGTAVRNTAQWSGNALTRLQNFLSGIGRPSTAGATATTVEQPEPPASTGGTGRTLHTLPDGREYTIAPGNPPPQGRGNPPVVSDTEELLTATGKPRR